jgi:hypothetical protein
MQSSVRTENPGNRAGRPAKVAIFEMPDGREERSICDAALKSAFVVYRC